MDGTKQKQGGYPPHSFFVGAIAANHPSQEIMISPIVNHSTGINPSYANPTPMCPIRLR